MRRQPLEFKGRLPAALKASKAIKARLAEKEQAITEEPVCHYTEDWSSSPDDSSTSDEEDSAVPPLATLVQPAVIELLGKVAGNDETFVLGGEAKTDQPVRIYLLQNSQSDVVDSVHQSADFKALDILGASIVATDCGSLAGPAEHPGAVVQEGGTAIRLTQGNFDCNLDLCELGILEHIRVVLAPDAATINAKLYEAMLFREGDCLRADVMLAHGIAQLGWLVIALPTVHDGGQLCVEHANLRQIFDWSLYQQPVTPDLQWAAFTADCHWEVDPITSGTQILLVYSLSAEQHVAPLHPSVNADSLAIYSKLRDALDHPGFLEHGATLAFGCQNRYPHTSAAFARNDIEEQLVGTDACLLAAARELGLHVQVRPVYVEPPGERDAPASATSTNFMDKGAWSPRKAFVGQNFYLRTDGIYDDNDAMHGGPGKFESVIKELEHKEVIWCNSQAHLEMAENFTVYGFCEDVFTDCLYSFPAIMVQIPSAAERSRPA